jgi:thioredoxin reductase (NADPH)
VEHIFPTLTPAQVSRVAAQGRHRLVERGEILVDVGAQRQPFFVVTAGYLEVVQRSGSREELLAVYRPGEFTGEASMLSGRRGLVRIRAKAPSEVIEVERERVLALIQTDSDLGDVLLRAFLLRRVELIVQGLGDVVVAGSNHCASTLRIKEFLTRNGHPYAFVDLDKEEDVQGLLDGFQVTLAEVPVVVCRGETVLKNPNNKEVADCLGFNDAVDQTKARDMVVIGAGPSGLAAALCGASEGLDVLVLEMSSPGGQASASSKIENYLGFPTGISGQDLAARAYSQAQKFGAEVLVAKGANRLRCGGTRYVVDVEDGPSIPARTIVIATGARYRKPSVASLPRFEGQGVYYGATFIESQVCRGEEVIVVGGGNAAGQAAVFLAESARRVTVVVRSSGLGENMSRYLIRRIEQNPAIEVKTRAEIESLEGDFHLERVGVRDNRTGVIESRDVRHVFLMMGAVPSTAWLEGCIALDPHGFIRTGPELTADDLTASDWTLGRAPHLLETSRPGIFAVGDVRAGNVKRVASAVGEGSIAIAFVHRVLQE